MLRLRRPMRCLLYHVANLLQLALNFWVGLELQGFFPGGLGLVHAAQPEVDVPEVCLNDGSSGTSAMAFFSSTRAFAYNPFWK